MNQSSIQMVESAIWQQLISKDDFICENVNYNAKGCELHYEQSTSHCFHILSCFRNVTWLRRDHLFTQGKHQKVPGTRLIVAFLFFKFCSTWFSFLMCAGCQTTLEEIYEKKTGKTAHKRSLGCLGFLQLWGFYFQHFHSALDFFGSIKTL